MKREDSSPLLQTTASVIIYLYSWCKDILLHDSHPNLYNLILKKALKNEDQS